MLETFDDNVLLKGITFGFGGYPDSRFSFDYILVFINQLCKEVTAIIILLY